VLDPYAALTPGNGLVEVVQEKLDSRGCVAAEDLLNQVRVSVVQRCQDVAVVLDPAQAYLRVQDQGFYRSRPPLLTAPVSLQIFRITDLHVVKASFTRPVAPAIPRR
jgi:hypothetical protein